MALGSIIPPRLSVVVTCYELGRYLPEALASIPVRDDVEVIVVDDGSKDPHTVQVLDDLDPRFVVVRQPNMGLAKARNNGVRQARGTYIIPLDADNRLHARFIEASMAILDRDEHVGVVYGDAMDFEGRDARRVVGPFEFTDLLRGNYIDACACFRRSAWETVGGYDEYMPYMGWEDWDFWLRCAVSGVRFSYVPEIFFDYRVRAGSMIEGTRKHHEELVSYIFAKDELRFLRTLRQQFMDAKKRLNDRQALLDSISTSDLVRALFGRIRKRAGGRKQA